MPWRKGEYRVGEEAFKKRKQGKNEKKIILIITITCNEEQNNPKFFEVEIIISRFPSLLYC